MTDLFRIRWGTPVEIERRRRIKLSLWAYAYEIVGVPLVDDATFDAMAYASNRDINTGRLDEWWRQHFQPYTGQWVHHHPEINRLAKLYVDMTVNWPKFGQAAMVRRS